MAVIVVEEVPLGGSTHHLVVDGLEEGQALVEQIPLGRGGDRGTQVVLQAPDHDVCGAELLSGLVAPRIVWLVRHHLDLLRAPRATRHRLGPGPALADLTRLRRLDERGRSPRARVLPPQEAVRILMEQPETLLPGGETASYHAPEIA